MSNKIKPHYAVAISHGMNLRIAAAGREAQSSLPPRLIAQIPMSENRDNAVNL